MAQRLIGVDVGGTKVSVAVLDGATLAVLDDLFAYNRGFLGGVFVGG